MVCFINNNACAFTGHRPSRFKFGYDEESEGFRRLYDALFTQTERLACLGITTFYTGMALGTDQWAALIVLQLKKLYPHIRLVAVRPCETQADKWSDEHRHRYYDVILPKADETVLISRPYTPTCMMERNRYMVDHAGHLLAVYDGGTKGGTAYTVGYARQQGRSIVTLHPDTLQVSTPEDVAALERRRQFRITEKE